MTELSRSDPDTLVPDIAPADRAIAILVTAFAAVAPQSQAEAFAMIEAMGANHFETQHWYLPHFDILPERRGQGLGTALIAPILSVCDCTGPPAYLEATSTRNPALYARLGFVPTANIEIADYADDPRHHDDLCGVKDFLGGSHD